MKKRMNLKMVFISAAIISLAACKNSNEPDQPKDSAQPSEKETVVLQGEINGIRSLSADTTYLLKGFVYVTDGSKLNIEAGTIIKGDKDTKATLIVEKGGKIEAIGTPSSPIVFTSNQAAGERNYGDWGGIIICGNGRTNSATGVGKIEGGPRSEYGGNDDYDNSGTLQYVRIEFPGVEYATDNEINGLTFGAVGSGTTIDHIQVSYCGDDSYEWFGGMVNASYLVAYRGWDDEFDTDNGYRGKVQFAVGLRDPNVADKSKSNGFESDNDASGSSNEPFTQAVFSNVSLFGPYTTTSDIVDPQKGNGQFQAAMHLQRNTQLTCYNSIFAGWPIGLFIENGGKGNAQENAINGSLILNNNIMAGMKVNFKEDEKGTADFNYTYWNESSRNNTLLTNNIDLGLVDPFNITSPKFYASNSNGVIFGKASFNSDDLSGMTNVNFVGAFDTEDWTDEWCNFDPQNTIY